MLMKMDYEISLGALLIVQFLFGGCGGGVELDIYTQKLLFVFFGMFLIMLTINENMMLLFTIQKCSISHPGSSQ